MLFVQQDTEPQVASNWVASPLHKMWTAFSLKVEKCYVSVVHLAEMLPSLTTEAWMEETFWIDV